MKHYNEHVLRIMTKLMDTQEKNILIAATLIYETIKNGHDFYIVGSGHSHMVAEEIYARAGGYAKIRPMLEPELMLHEHPLKSTLIERLPGYAEVLLSIYPIKEGDTIVVISNSGRNVLPIEMAMGAKERGAKVIAITNVTHSSQVSSRHANGKRLMDICDCCIDNCGDYGDASYKVEGFDVAIGATSTMTGAYIAQSMINEVVRLEVADKGDAPVFRSSNVDGSDAYNQGLMSRHKLLRD